MAKQDDIDAKKTDGPKPVPPAPRADPEFRRVMIYTVPEENAGEFEEHEAEWMDFYKPTTRPAPRCR